MNKKFKNKILNDKYKKLAYKLKLRSRSWFKIKEIQKKNKLIKKKNNILDLGSSPGGWSKFLSKKIKKIGKIFSCDILPMKKIKKVKFIQGDICKKKTIKKIIKITKLYKINAILSDISPNLSGIKEIDNPKYKNIINKIILLCNKKLIKQGNLLIKVFLGDNFKYTIKKIKKIFKIVKVFKPKSSYNSSKEIYIIALKYKK